MAEGAGGGMTTALDLDAIEARAKGYLVGKRIDWLASNRLANDVVGVIAEVRRLRDDAGSHTFTFATLHAQVDAAVERAESAEATVAYEEQECDAWCRSFASAIARAEKAEAERDRFQAAACEYDCEVGAAIARAESAEAKVAEMREALSTLIYRMKWSVERGAYCADMADVNAAIDAALALDSTDGRKA